MVKRAALPLILVLGLAWTAQSSAAIPIDGPQLAFNRQRAHFPRHLDSLKNFSNLRLKSDLVTSGPFGEQAERLLRTRLPGAPFLSGGPAWSADGATLALTLITHAKYEDATDIYVVNRDGSGLRAVTQFGDVDRPVFSIDGGSLYFSRPASRGRSAIWAVKADGTGARQLTPLVGGESSPSSVSPTNGDIALSRTTCTEGIPFPAPIKCRSSVGLLSPATGVLMPLVQRATDAAFSPDGMRIAYVSQRDDVTSVFPDKDKEPIGDLYVLDLATGQRVRLTKTKHASEATPSWDPSGQRLAFVRNKARSSRLVEINGDGTCETALPREPTRPRVHFFYDGPTWQPGPGREAGRIAC